MRSNLGRLRRTSSRSLVEQLATLTSVGDGSTLSLDFTTGVLDPRLTFTRLSGGTYVANDGYIYGMDFATSSSLAIGTGSKSVTLTATASVDRRYLVGQTVWISNGANNMRGPVTAYNASTQVLTINATGTSGSGSFTSWTVGNASARFDHDPTTLAPRGLLIEGTATNLLNWSESFATSGGASNNWADTNITRNSTNNTDPANGTTALRVTASAGNGTIISTAAMGTSAQRTFSIWLRRVSGTGNIQYTLDNGSTYTTQAITSSWVRYTFAATTAAQRVGIRIVTSGDSIELWGAMLEQGSGASSYIPTGASQGSRAADSCVMTGTNFSSWFAGAVEGVLYAEFERPRSQSGTIGHDHFAVGSQYASGSAFAVYSAASVYYPTTFLWPTGGAIFPGGIASAIPSVSKQAGKWFNGNDATNFANGVQGTTTAGTGTLTPTMLSIGANSATGTQATRDWLNACVRRVKFWPVALPDSQIISITT